MLIEWFLGQKRERRQNRKRVDVVAQQVKDLLQKADQKLILMVRQ